MSKLDMNFEFQINNKENICANANLISNISDCNQIPVLPNYVSEIKLKNPYLFDNYDFDEIIHYDNALQSEKRSFPEVFKNLDMNQNVLEEKKKKTIKTPFVMPLLYCYRIFMNFSTRMNFLKVNKLLWLRTHISV